MRTLEDNTRERAKKVRDIVAKHYEAGRQDRCKRWVYLHIVRKIYPISERTFYRYLGIKDDEKE